MLPLKFFITLISALVFVSCSGTIKQLNENEYLFETNYWNLKKKTVFKMKNGKLAEGIYLYDSKGNEKLTYPYSDKLDYYELNYRAKDEESRPARNYQSVAKGFDDFIKTMRYDYRQFFDKGEGYVHFTVLAWVNDRGRVEHAVCLENIGSPMQVIYSIITDLENFQFPVEKGVKLGVFKKTYTVHVMHHNDYIR